MRIPSGVTDQYIYFVAVDATDFKTREVGLNTWTVYRSRNGAAAAAFTTPTINETDATNMPGVYELLLDEDMTIDAGDQSQEVCVHITHAGMAPVTRTFELYRSTVTPGETITVSSGAVSNVGTLTTYTGNTPQTGDAFARLGAPAAASVSADILAIDNLVDDLESRLGTPSNLGSGATVAANLVDIESQTDDIGVAGAGLTNIGTIATVTNLTNLPAITANWLTATGINADAFTAAKFADDVSTEFANKVWDTDATAHQTQGTFGQAIGDPGADTDTIWALANTNLDAAVSTRMATYTQPTGFLAATFPSGTIANTTNITAGTITTTTNLTTNNDKTGYSLTAVTGLGNQTADITGTITTATNVTTVNGLAANVITAASIATGAIDADALAADGVTEIMSVVSGTADSGSTTTMVDAARTEADTDYWKDMGILFTSGTIAGQARLITAFTPGTDTITFSPATTQAVGTNTYEIFRNVAAAGASAPTAAQVADAVWDEAQADHVGAGTFGVIASEVADVLVDTAEIGAAGAGLTNINLPNQTMDIVGNITGNVSGSVGSVTGAVGSVTGNVGGNVVGSVASVTAAVDITAAAVDLVWDEATAGHTTAGTTGKALIDAGSAGDPWGTALPGAYGAGTAGKIVGDNLNATVGSRASQTSLDTLDDYVDTEVTAIKAKTDSLTFTVAGQVDANIQSVNDVTVTGNGQPGTEWGP